MELGKEFRDKFVRNLQGRDFILYGGLLELSRQKGLKRIETRIVQVPSKENGMYAVVEAEIETSEGIFKEIGDASPESVNRSIVPHLLRMASTRAKARAMRDAVGIDMVALEELGDHTEVIPDDSMFASGFGEGSNESRGSEDLILDFGKYAGRSIREVAEADRGYVEWLSQNARVGEVRRAARDVLERFGTLDEESGLPDSKH